MNKIFLTAIIGMASICASAQEPVDTVKVINNAREIVVTQSDKGTVFTVTSTADDPEFFYSYSTSAGAIADDSSDGWGLSLPFLNEEGSRKEFNTVWLQDTYIGITNPLSAPRGVTRSVAAGISKLVGASWQPSRKGPIFAIGIGFHLEKYSLHGSQLFYTSGKHLGIADLPAGTSDYHSRLFNFGLQIPVTISQNIYKGWGFSVGASLMFNTYTKATANYTIDNIEYSNSYKGLQQRAATVDIFAAVGKLDDYGLFVRYSPVPLMRKGYGPQFETLTFGLTLGF